MQKQQGAHSKIKNHKEDSFYRYKRSELKYSHIGKGNKSFTVLNNIDQISKELKVQIADKIDIVIITGVI